MCFTDVGFRRGFKVKTHFVKVEDVMIMPKNSIAAREHYINTVTSTINMIKKDILKIKSHISTIERNPKSVSEIEERRVWVLLVEEVKVSLACSNEEPVDVVDDLKNAI